MEHQLPPKQNTIIFSHTPGPWQWQLNQRGKDVRLVALHSGTKFVMDFERWGMQSAQPRFNNGFMEPASGLATIVPGREHHADWFKTISHPDALLIAAAPDLLEALQNAASLIPLWGVPSVAYEQDVPEGRKDEYGALHQMQLMIERAITKATGHLK